MKENWILWEFQQRVRKHNKKKKKQFDLKNTIAKIKNALERIQDRLDDAEKWICNLENIIVEITEIKQKKEF